MKIYVIMKGAYSDRHVVTATLDPVKAKKIAEKFSDDYDDCWIDEFEDGDFMLRDLWYVSFYGDGSIQCVSKENSEYCYEGAYNDKSIRCNVRNGKVHAVWMYVFADNEEHAIKIATDKRAEFLAQQNGLI